MWRKCIRYSSSNTITFCIVHMHQYKVQLPLVDIFPFQCNFIPNSVPFHMSNSKAEFSTFIIISFNSKEKIVVVTPTVL